MVRSFRALADLAGGHGSGQLINVLFGISEISLPFTLSGEYTEACI
jgi:hypothetical protein